MKLFTVTIKEVHRQIVSVQAKDKIDAILRVQNGEGVYINGTEYLDTLSVDRWDVEEAGKK